MVEVKAMLKEEVLDGQLREKLREIAAVIVKEIVRREIAERVRREVRTKKRFQNRLVFILTLCHSSKSRFREICASNQPDTNARYWK